MRRSERTRWTERPRELLARATSFREEPSAEVTRRVEERHTRERLEASHSRLVAGVHNRPEDSSPAIRRMLGYDQPGRPPRRWEAQAMYDGTLDGVRLEYVDAGPVEP